MSERLRRYQKALGNHRMLCPVSEKLMDLPGDGKECEKTAAFYVMAPVMCMYVAWVLRQAYEQGKRRLYFLARDGYSMYEVARIFCEKTGLPIECRYLYCSRYAWRRAEYHLLGEDSLSYICLNGIDVNFRKLMSRAGLNDEEGKEIARSICLEEGCEAPLNCRRLRELRTRLAGCKLFMDRMQEKSRNCYPLVAAYLEQEGLLDTVPWALVDSGWTGSMQKSLQHLLGAMGYEEKIEGYYFGMYEYPGGTDPDTYHCWYFAPGEGLRRKVYFSNSLFECIFSSPEGMAVGYEKQDGTYGPVLEKRWNPNREKILGTTGCLKQYARELADASGKGILSDSAQEQRNRRIAFSLLKSFMGRPSSGEVRAYGSYVFCDDVIGEGDQRVAAALTRQQIRENRILNKALARLKRKGSTIRESAWLEGSIVRNGMGGGELWLCAVGKYVVYLRKLAGAYKNRSGKGMGD